MLLSCSIADMLLSKSHIWWRITSKTTFFHSRGFYKWCVRNATFHSKWMKTTIMLISSSTHSQITPANKAIIQSAPLQNFTILNWKNEHDTRTFKNRDHPIFQRKWISRTNFKINEKTNKQNTASQSRRIVQFPFPFPDNKTIYFWMCLCYQEITLIGLRWRTFVLYWPAVNLTKMASSFCF